MNLLICVLAVLCAVSAQRWGGPGNHANQANRGSWSGYAPKANFAPAPLAHDGRVVDTPDIVQAKAAHFAAHDAAAKAAPHRPQFIDYHQNNQASQNYESYDDRSNDRYNDRYNDRPNERYNEQPNERNYDDFEQNQVEKKWRGPFAKIEFTQDGKFIKETPEVAHARQQHLAALSAAKKNSNVGYEGNYDDGSSGQYREPQQQAGRYANQNNNRWQGNQQSDDRSFQGEDDGQYRGEGSGQYNRRTNWQGQGNQFNGRPQGGYY